MNESLYNFIKHNIAHRILKSAAKYCEPKYCCDMMKEDLTRYCDKCTTRFECPDCLIYKTKDGGYGIIIHDGTESWITIKYCPWCGKEL